VVPTVQPRLSPRFEPAPQAGVLNAPRPFGPLADETALDATIMEDGGHSPHRTTRSPTNQQVTLTTLLASGEDGFIAAAPHQKIITPTSDLSARTTTVAGAVPMTDVFTQSQRQEPRPLLASRLHTIRPVSSTTEQRMLIDSAVNGANAVKADAAPSRVTGQSKDAVRQKAPPEDRTMPAAQVETVSTSHPSTQLSPLLPIIAQPRVRPVSMEQSDAGHGRYKNAAEPVASTIQVTIGRIEIRAEQTTASAAAKSRGAQPVMSLDEYLRNRGSGGGR
jgi:hypothetical protein